MYSEAFGKLVENAKKLADDCSPYREFGVRYSRLLSEDAEYMTRIMGYDSTDENTARLNCGQLALAISRVKHRLANLKYGMVFGSSDINKLADQLVKEALKC